MSLSINKTAPWEIIAKRYFRTQERFWVHTRVYFTPIDDSYSLLKKGEKYYLDADGHCRNIKGNRMGCGLLGPPVYWIGTSPNVIYLGGE